MKIPFTDLKPQFKEIKVAANRAFGELVKRGDYILGRDVREFECSFAGFIGTKYALGVNSGTDALFLGLLGLGIGPKDEVIVPTYTYIASAFAITYTGATPVFVDIDEKTFNIDISKIEKAITSKTKAIMPVHLYGQSADMRPILRIAKKHGLKVIEDAAQAHGAEYHGKKVGCIGDIGAFSFYPTKNLGAFGDGGMLVTNDEKLFEKLKKLRDYGRKTRYEHVSLGYNSRLDSVQALFLGQKLKKLDEWNKRRILAAKLYRKLLCGAENIILPEEASYGKHVYHIFAVRVKNRDAVLEGLKKAGVNAAVHYPIALHLQEVYRDLGYKTGDFPVAEKISHDVLCLPIYPHIKESDIKYVVKILKGLVKNG
ncbi:MAG: DegT/DnrJ/EryC1/StrS family aminotransferase [Candidatus Omnitrophica bacterium]|nr:DegT/DnrJ/EryC1/StrS family aminotransferase [Candidatus Omnitrophota bacterium]